MSTATHAELCELGARWLRSKGCRVVLQDPFKAAVWTGEIPDVIGWRDGHSILIECKTTRADFKTDQRKKFRADPEMGMGDARLYLTPPGLLRANELPEGWGLLEAQGRRVTIVGDYPRQYVCSFWGEKRKRVDWRPLPFRGNKTCETVMLVSALARVSTIEPVSPDRAPPTACALCACTQ